MIVGTVRLSAMSISDDVVSSAMPRVDSVDELKFSNTTKDDIRLQVKLAVHAMYGVAVGTLAKSSALSALSSDRTSVAAIVDSALGEVTHIAHIEYDDGTTEALSVDVGMEAIARSTCEILVHRMFNQGVKSR